MGGLAVAIDWVEPVDNEAFDRMVDAMTHRGPAGTQTTTRTNAHLAEARLPRDGSGDWDIATVGRYTLVGDLRLWNRDDLCAMAATDETDDRMLILHAYRRHGPAIMEHVDGDFAFVIWDAQDHTAFAARDRFGVKPLWMARTPTGIRFASETAQLSTAADQPVPTRRRHRGTVPDRHVRLGLPLLPRGISRVMPGHTVTASHGIRDCHPRTGTRARHPSPTSIPATCQPHSATTSSMRSGVGRAAV